MFEKSCQFQVHRMRYRLHASSPEAEVSIYSTECDGSQDFSNTLSKVHFFFKQWGGKRKHETGRELDGRTYDAMPILTDTR